MIQACSQLDQSLSGAISRGRFFEVSHYFVEFGPPKAITQADARLMDTIVTGDAGFIGSTLVDRPTRDGHRVHVIDNSSRGRRDKLAAAEGTSRCTV